ncbi:MAG TPA: outer membrane beta-barrel protein, partial [Flavobacterium sp.]|nr:outer membrane beta-barrel protein [Flavobacterium sp.]
DPENTSKQIMTFDNFDNNTAFGFEVSANYKINTWWDVQPSVDYSNVSQKGLVSVKTAVPNVFDFVEKEVSVSAFNARLNSNFKATQNLRFLLFGFYRGDVERIQFHNQEMYKIDAGARYSMMNDKLTASVRFNDIFNTMKAEFEGEDPFPSHGEFRWESQSVFFGINYMFGSGKNRALQRKQREENTNQGGGGMF